MNLRSGADCDWDFTIKRGTSMVSGHPSWFTCSTTNKSAALKLQKALTISYNPSGKAKWAWIRMPMTISPHCWIITAMKKVNNLRERWRATIEYPEGPDVGVAAGGRRRV